MNVRPQTMALSEEDMLGLMQNNSLDGPQKPQGQQEDPFLEAMMRQAQMGIFVTPNKETGANVSARGAGMPAGDASKKE